MKEKAIVKLPQPTKEELIARLMKLPPKEFWLRAEAMQRAIRKNQNL